MSGYEKCAAIAFCVLLFGVSLLIIGALVVFHVEVGQALDWFLALSVGAKAMVIGACLSACGLSVGMSAATYISQDQITASSFAACCAAAKCARMAEEAKTANGCDIKPASVILNKLEAPDEQP